MGALVERPLQRSGVGWKLRRRERTLQVRSKAKVDLRKQRQIRKTPGARVTDPQYLERKGNRRGTGPQEAGGTGYSGAGHLLHNVQPPLLLDVQWTCGSVWVQAGRQQWGEPFGKLLWGNRVARHAFHDYRYYNINMYWIVYYLIVIIIIITSSKGV